MFLVSLVGVVGILIFYFMHLAYVPGFRARRCKALFARCLDWSPQFGVGRRGSPRFVLICSVFFRFVPICAPSLREYPDLFRFVPFSSDLFRFVFRTYQNKSGKPLSADPFCKSPIRVLSLKYMFP